MTSALKVLLSLVAAVLLTLVGTVPATAAPPRAAATVQFTLDADGTTLPLAAAAVDWSKNTGISVVVGDCTGANCIHFKVVQTSCGIGAASGCAYRISDGSCQVEVDQWVADRGNTAYTDELVTKHEAGHCIWSYLGVSQSYHLPDEPHALMSATHSTSPSLKDATLTSTDRRFTKSLVG
jgi:hypothetical protein